MGIVNMSAATLLPLAGSLTQLFVSTAMRRMLISRLQPDQWQQSHTGRSWLHSAVFAAAAAVCNACACGTTDCGRILDANLMEVLDSTPWSNLTQLSVLCVSADASDGR